MNQLDNELIHFFLTINKTLQKLSFRYCLIGGFAAGYWAEPRYTRDIDFTISLSHHDISTLKKAGKGIFSIQSKADDQFRAIQINNSALMADFIISGTDYQEWVIQRAQSVELFGVRIPICSLEDLIILKLIANRRQDLLDIENALNHHYPSIDRAYLKPWMTFWELGPVYVKEFESSFPLIN